MNKIVLTGGPCGGKSATLASIDKNYKKEGHNFYLIDETATTLFINEFNKILINGQSISKFDFQTIIFLVQFIKEYNAETDFLYKGNGNKSTIICDRGLLDGKAYMNNSDFKNMLKKFNLDESFLLKTYSVVFHLTSIYFKDKDFFKEHRPFAVDDVLDIDYNLWEIWKKCPNHFIVPITNLIEEKINIIYKYLDDVIDYNSPMLHDFYNEIDFKYMRGYLREFFYYYSNNTSSEDKAKILKLHNYYKERNIV